MEITGYRKPGINATLLLALERDRVRRRYFLLKDDRGRSVMLLDENPGSGASGCFTFYYSRKEWEADFRELEQNAPQLKRWWTFCPGWSLFNPAFIHHSLKPYFSEKISEVLDGLSVHDLTNYEKERLRVWMKACEHDTRQLKLLE